MKQQMHFLPTLTIFIVLTLTGCSENNRHHSDSDSLSAIEEARIDSLRRDSLLKDSLIQDSIARRNLTTSDLSFNELHGDVKNYKFKDNVIVYRDFIFSYNEDGSIIPSWTAEDNRLKKSNNQTSLPKEKITRDNEGRIIKIWEFASYDGDYGDFFNKDYVWEGNRAIGKYESKNTREYDDKGLLISYVEDKNYDIQPNRIVFTDYVLDGLGNWVERKANIFTYEPDEMSTFGYPICKESMSQKRIITYYKSNGEQRIRLENSSRQKELLKKEQQRYSKAKNNYTYDEIY